MTAKKNTVCSAIYYLTFSFNYQIFSNNRYLTRTLYKYSVLLIKKIHASVI
jgi:hypothetical protein